MVGGFLRGDAKRFAALCTDLSQTLRLRTEARSQRGPEGAGDLRLRVREGQSGEPLCDSDH